MTPRSLLILIIGSLMLTAVGAWAQSKAAPPHPPITAIRLTAPINVDGVLDEPVWSSGTPVTEFYQSEPHQGEPARFRTEARVAFDDDAIYVGIRMFDPAPDSIIARLTRRDDSVPTDRVCVYLDPYHDRRSGYYFVINAAGTLLDGTLSNDGWEDGSWDGVWEGRERHNAEGWTAEYRIPTSQLRFQNADPQVWGVNFRRVIARCTETDMVAYQPTASSGFVSRFPDLVGLEGVHPTQTIELTPYVTTKASYLQHPENDPFNDGTDYVPNAGADLRMGVGPRLTLNATVNPDFGQVEVDPATLNLSDLETFYPEKRPFFVEGSQVFRFGNEGANDYWNFNWPEPTFFYSRRIGRAPQGSVPDSAYYSDYPDGTRILGAAKLTGKISPTMNFGTMHAITGRERADVQWAAGGHEQLDVEPLTYYGVVRTQKEFKDRNQGLGLMANLVERSFDDVSLSNQLNRTSSMAGLDGWVFLDSSKTWVISGYTAFSYVAGTTARLIDLQADPRHYFQRPDAHHVEMDSSATSLTGEVARLWLNKQKGRVFSNSGIGVMTPGFEINDLGFESYADVLNAHSVLGYRWPDRGKKKRFARTDFAAMASEDLGGHLTSIGFFNFGYVQFVNNHEVNTNLGYNPDFTTVRRTRGGPRMLRPYGWTSNLNYNTDPSRRMVLFMYGEYDEQPSAHSSFWTFVPQVDLKPRSNIQLSIAPGVERNVENAQYVATLDDPLAVETYGRQYVFGELDQSTAYANIRLSWAFSPTMTLQAFVQPYVSIGKYTSYKALARPATYEFYPVAAPYDADFDFRSLRGNTVFRWEYRPGSAFFLAWTQDRSAIDGDSEGSLTSHVSDIVRQPPNNVFLAKFTYYLHL